MSRERRPGDVPCGQRTRHRRYRPQARPDRGPSRVAAGGNGRQSLGAVSPARELEGGNNPPARAPCLAPATRGPLRFWQDRSRVWRENSVERGASTGRDRPGMARSKKSKAPAHQPGDRRSTRRGPSDLSAGLAEHEVFGASRKAEGFKLGKKRAVGGREVQGEYIRFPRCCVVFRQNLRVSETTQKPWQCVTLKESSPTALWIHCCAKSWRTLARTLPSGWCESPSPVR